MYKAFSIWGKDTGKFDFNPHFFNYPSFYFYIQFIVQGLYFLFGRLLGSFSSLTAFRFYLDQEVNTFVILGRIITMLFGVFTVFLTYLLGERFFNRKIALATSFFLALNFVHVINSQYISVDVPLTLFVILSLIVMHSVYERALLRDYVFTGLCIGLGIGTKYTAAILVIPFLVAHFLSKRGSRSLQKRIINPKIFIGIIAIIFSFFLVSPFCFLDFPSFWRDFSIEMRHMSTGHFGQEDRVTHYLSYLFGPLWKGLGLPLEIFSLLGLVISIIRHRKKELLFLSFPIIYFAVVGRWSVQTDRYMLPIIPFFLILASSSLFFISEKMSFLRKNHSILFGICTFGLIIPSLLSLIEYRTAQKRCDTRTLAKEWIEENLPRGLIIILESQTPTIAKNNYTCVYIPIYTVTPELTAPFYDMRWYGGSHFIILSSYVYGRYQRQPQKYSRQNQFYAELDTSFALVKEFGLHDGRGPVIKIYKNQNIQNEISESILAPLKILFETPALTVDRKANFLFELGSAYLQGGHTIRGAIVLLRAASQLQPQNFELHSHLATAYFLNGQKDQSIAECDKIIQLKPNSPKAHLIRAIVLDEAGRTEEAIASYQKYILLKPKDILAYVRMSAAYEKIDKVEDAVNTLYEILKMDPSNTYAKERIKHLQDVSP